MGFIKQFIYRLSSILLVVYRISLAHPQWFIGNWQIPMASDSRDQKDPWSSDPKSIPLFVSGSLSIPPLLFKKKHNCLVLWNMFSHIFWECHHPNWRTPSFFRGVAQPPWFSRGSSHENFISLAPWFSNGEAVPFPRDALTRPSWCTGWMRWDGLAFLAIVFWRLDVYDWHHIMSLSMNIYI